MKVPTKPFTEMAMQTLRALYAREKNGAGPIPSNENARWQAGAMEKHTVSKILQNHKEPVNSAMGIPLRKAYGIEEVRVNPEIAQHWLTFNTSNRELTQKKVEQFQADMEGGYWNRDGATVRFAYGKLLDGQHRLTALALAGATIRMIVVHGLDSEVQVTMDTGRGRTPRDVLSIEGMEKWESAVLGSAMHAVIAYEAGLSLYSNRKYTNREVRNYYLEHSAALNSTVNRVKGYPRRHPQLPHMRTVAMHYILAKIDPDAADQFFDRLMTGEHLTKASPIFHLRARLQSDLVEGKTRTAYEQMHFIVRAWNTYRSGGTLKSQNSLYPRQGDMFPEIAR